jgi:spermidine synthase
VIVLYAATLFVSATLVFAVQPLVTKMVLPLLGGTPAVWTTAMMFFQGLLLLGYAFAHALDRLAPGRRQALIQLAALGTGALVLPIAIGDAWRAPAGTDPIFWLLALLAVSVGLPFFALSATAPLLQRWFAASGHARAADPYPLYGASNAGSLLALVLYPLAAEPLLRLGEQSLAWSGGYALLIALTAACALTLPRRARSSAAAPAPRTAPPWTLRLRWCGLAFAPSTLLLGVTTFLTTDIAAVPLFWVVPLALYLLTFIVAFARTPIVPHARIVQAQPWFVLPLVLVLFWGSSTGLIAFYPVHLAAFFVTALVCHGELARTRPAVEHLTEFYLWLAIGGLAGGVFNALVAPYVFTQVIEYPLAVALALAMRPAAAPRRPLAVDLGYALVLPAVLFLLAQIEGGTEAAAGLVLIGVLSAAIVLALVAFRAHPLRLGVATGLALMVGVFFVHDQGGTLARSRNFFGAVAVVDDGPYRLLMHGTTVHGVQGREGAERLEPLAYFTREGPLGHVFAALKERLAGARIAVTGLGAGAIACYAEPGQDWTFYEIDPAVVAIARDPRYFTLLRDCAPDARVVLGDARLTLAEAPDAHYRLIILDAFSSDSVPVHLINREAVRLYLAKLEAGGVLVFNITNRYLDLVPVLAALATDAELVGYVRGDAAVEPERHRYSSGWVIVGRSTADIASLAADPRWVALAAVRNGRPWTDDFSNVVGAFRW